MGGRSYSQDLRSRVLGADGLSARQAAERFAVSVSYVIKARQRRDRTGELATRPRGWHRPSRLAAHAEAIAAEVARRPSATLADLRAWLVADRGVSIGLTMLWKTLRGLGLTLKKSRSGPASRRGRTSLPRARRGPHCNAI